MSQRQRNSRSVTFRMPESQYELVQAVAFAELRAEVGDDASTNDINLSEFFRHHIGDLVAAQVAEAPGGLEGLEERYRHAQEREILERLAELRQSQSLG